MNGCKVEFTRFLFGKCHTLDALGYQGGKEEEGGRD